MAVKNKQVNVKKVSVKNDANSIISNAINNSDIMNEYRNVQESIRSKNILNFSRDLQVYGVQLALIISKGMISPTMGKDCNYRDAVHFLCVKILNDSLLKNYIEVSPINPVANGVKHTADKNKKTIDIESTVYHFNKMIDKLVKIINAPVLNKLKLTISNSTSVQTTKTPSSTTSKKPQQKQNPIVSKHIANDDGISVEAEIVRGKGIVSQHKLFGRETKKVQFNLELRIRSNYKILDLSAALKIKDGYEELKIKEGLNEYAISTSKLENNLISITISVKYRIKLGYSKDIKFTIRKHF